MKSIREYKEDIEKSITQIQSNLDKINAELDKRREWSRTHADRHHMTITQKLIHKICSSLKDTSHLLLKASKSSNKAFDRAKFLER